MKKDNKEIIELAEVHLKKHGLKASNASAKVIYGLGFYEAIDFREQYYEDKFKKTLKEIKDRKFPRGERQWCVECCQRITEQIKSNWNK